MGSSKTSTHRCVHAVRGGSRANANPNARSSSTLIRVFGRGGRTPPCGSSLRSRRNDGDGGPVPPHDDLATDSRVRLAGGRRFAGPCGAVSGGAPVVAARITSIAPRNAPRRGRPLGSCRPIALWFFMGEPRRPSASRGATRGSSSAWRCLSRVPGAGLIRSSISICNPSPACWFPPDLSLKQQDERTRTVRCFRVRWSLPGHGCCRFDDGLKFEHRMAQRRECDVHSSMR